MPWFRVDDRFHAHPKALAVSLAALGLWTAAGSWSSANCTGGEVPDHVIPLLSRGSGITWSRSEEHTSELQSREKLVCRLLLEKKNYDGALRGTCVVNESDVCAVMFL